MFKSIVIIIVIYLSLINLSFADAKLDKAKQQQQQTKQELTKLEQNLQQTKNEQHQAQLKLRQVEQQISKLQASIKNLSQQQQQTKQELTKLEQQQQLLNNQLDVGRIIIAAQIKAAYKNSKHHESLRLALNQQNISQINRFLTYYQYLTTAQQDQIKQFEQNLRQLETNNAKITANHHQQQEQLAQLTNQQKALTKNKQERQNLIKSLDKKQQSTSQKIASNKQQQAEINKLIAQIESANKRKMLSANKGKFGTQRGKLSLPTRGKIVAKFGEKRGSSGLNWDGVLISVPAGNTVNAIYQGTVVYADWMSGLGYLIIISHGDNYLSLYGHNQNLFKNKGDVVTTGDPIATVGESGGISSPALYFAIRYQGKAQNPTLWCK